MRYQISIQINSLDQQHITTETNITTERKHLISETLYVHY